MLTRNLLSEQLEYTEEKESDCTKWLVVCRINGHLYGATCVFYNPNISENIMMQGISRSFIPSLLDSIFPNILNNLPRLNSILLPVVESIARSVNAKNKLKF